MNRRKIAFASVYSALAIVISPLYFQWGITKAFPGQHLINVLAGITLGPFWAVLVAFIVGTIRIMIGTGSFFAYPGGIPGGFVVGLSYIVLRKAIGREKAILVSALMEPIGTVIVGGTISWFIVDPFTGRSMQLVFASILMLYFGWLASSLTGCILGAIVTITLYRMGVLKIVFGE
ncbi:MAG: energy coupling factor transporter S component ThiW [Nitrososphaeria archaeon]